MITELKNKQAELFKNKNVEGLVKLFDEAEEYDAIQSDIVRLIGEIDPTNSAMKKFLGHDDFYIRLAALDALNFFAEWKGQTITFVDTGSTEQVRELLLMLRAADKPVPSEYGLHPITEVKWYYTPDSEDYRELGLPMWVTL